MHGWFLRNSGLLVLESAALVRIRLAIPRDLL